MTDQIFYVHAKRSSRLEPGHWFLDSKKLAPIGELAPKSNGWVVHLKSHPLPMLTFGTPEAACGYLAATLGRPVRKLTPRQFARFE